MSNDKLDYYRNGIGIKYNGISSDKDKILTALGGPPNINNTLTPVYRQEDVNIDGKIRYNGTDNDRGVISSMLDVPMNTIAYSNNIILQQTPN